MGGITAAPELGRGYSESEVAGAIAEIEAAIGDVSACWGGFYGMRLGLERDQCYWMRVFGGFLTCFSAAVYDALRDPGSSSVEFAAASVIAGYDLVECDRLMREDDDYRAVLRADVRLVAVGGHPTVELDESTAATGSGANWKQRLESLLAGPGTEVVLYLTPTVRADRLKLSLASWRRIGVGEFHEPAGVKPDPRLRSELADALRNTELPSTDLGRTLMRLLPKYLPVLLLESLAERIAALEKTVARARPRRIVSGYGFLTNVEFAVWAAECGRLGTEIWGWQHGGNYGECEATFSERTERRLCDRFVSWGWEDGGTDVVALPAPRQFLRRSGERATNGRILWVTTADSRHVYYIDHLLFGPRFNDYFGHQARAFTALNPELRSRVDVRLYPRDFGWGLRDRWMALDTAIAITPQGEPLGSMAGRYDLVVIDHFGGTTLLECLLLDVPFMMIGQPQFFLVRETTRELFDEMCRQGVFQTEPTAFGDLLEKRFGEIEAWWNEQPRRRAVSAYREHLLKPSADYVDEWRRAMLQ